MVSSLTVASSLPLCNFTPQQRFLSALARVSRTSFYLVMVAPVTNAVDALWMWLFSNSQFAVPGFKLRKGATEVQQQRLARCDEWSRPQPSNRASSFSLFLAQWSSSQRRGVLLHRRRPDVYRSLFPAQLPRFRAPHFRSPYLPVLRLETLRPATTAMAPAPLLVHWSQEAAAPALFPRAPIRPPSSLPYRPVSLRPLRLL